MTTGAVSPDDGAGNTALLTGRDASSLSGTQTNLAARSCASLSLGGYEDWYLPATDEAAILYANRADLPVSSGTIWTSTETNNQHAVSLNLGTGATTAYQDKWIEVPLLCVRAQAAPLP